MLSQESNNDLSRAKKVKALVAMSKACIRRERDFTQTGCYITSKHRQVDSSLSIEKCKRSLTQHECAANPNMA